MGDRSDIEKAGPRFRRYALIALGIPVLVGLGVAAFNAFADPYDLFGWSPGPKPAIHRNKRLHKALRIAELRPDVVVLGSSRPESGIDPRDPHLQELGRKVYNAAFPDASIYELRRYAQHSAALAEEPRFLIGLDFYTFHILPAANPTFSEQRLAVSARGRWQPFHRWADLGVALLTPGATALSWTTLERRGDQVPEHRLRYREIGLEAGARSWIRRNRSQYWAFRNKEFGILYSRGTQYLRAKLNPHLLEDAREDLRALLADCGREGIPVDAFLPPVHARLLYCLEALGMIDEFAAWKRELAAIFAEARAAHPDAHLRLWDFNTWNAYTIEPLVGPDDRAATMVNHWEPSHFKPHVGAALLARIYGESGDPSDPETDFGILLDGSNVDEHLAIQDRRRQAYLAANPRAVEEIEADLQLIRELQAQAIDVTEMDERKGPPRGE